jgi:hypothetical protein
MKQSDANLFCLLAQGGLRIRLKPERSRLRGRLQYLGAVRCRLIENSVVAAGERHARACRDVVGRPLRIVDAAHSQDIVVLAASTSDTPVGILHAVMPVLAGVASVR